MTPFRINLIGEFEARKRKNARFSLRAFARLLELAPSTVHQYLSGRYYPNSRNLQQMAGKLAWNDELLRSFVQYNAGEAETKTTVSFQNEPVAAI